MTGATSGIGAAFAAELPKTTDLLLTGRDADKLAAAQSALARVGRTVETMVADLGDEAAVQTLIDRAERFGIDLLINNAGTGRLGAVIDNAPEAERETVMVNVVAVVALTRGLLPGIIARARKGRRRGGVIIVSSTAAFAPVPFFATYAASKAFDLHFAEALAEELRDRPVDVLALCPGATRTAFGTRAGYESGSVPGATDPASVARQGLAALGGRSVHVTGFINQLGLGPLLAPRRLVAGTIGAAVRLFGGRSG
ncbi:MAG: SDR family NAD(P)-dependent oxidoreductase [Rhodospirillales bacterium]